MRGKELQLRHARVRKGITPANAGKRLKRSRSIDRFEVRPLNFHSVSHKVSASGGSRAKHDAPPSLPVQNAVPM